MKHPSLPALALAGALLFTLSACSPKASESTPTPDPLPSESANLPVSSPEAQPTESMNIVTPAPTHTPEPQPDPSADVVPPQASDSPAAPTESQGPVQVPPSQTPAPTPEPDPTPEAKAPTAGEVYEKVSAVAGGNAMSDMSFVLEDFYSLSAGDLEEFAFYMPEMSATTEEIFIARVKSGKMDAVKGACESRHQGLKEEAAMYPTAAEYVENARIVTNGDWILFVVAEHPAEAESAFLDCTK